MLIEALAKDHRKKTVELFLEQERVRKIKEGMAEAGAGHQREIEGLLTEI